jgi:hypothetical protein
MENGPFIDDFPIKTSIYKGFSMAMLNNQRVYIHCMVFRHVRATCYVPSFQTPLFVDENVTGNIREPLDISKSL